MAYLYNMDLRKEKYRNGLTTYGVSTLCYLIDEFEVVEDYEECAIIKEVIEEFNIEMKETLPTRLSDCRAYLEKNTLSNVTAVLDKTPYFAKQLKQKKI